MRQFGSSIILCVALAMIASVSLERWTTARAQGCSYTVLPLTVTVPGAGGTGQLTVTTSPGCTWTASSITAWLSVNPAGGVGSGSVTWSATANPLSSQRIGYLTVAGRSIFFGQTATTASTTPSNLAAQVSGSTLTLTWTAPGLTGVTGYVVEVGSAPGLANLASIPTGATPTFTAANVPAGTYFMRVRAVASGIVGAPSNEVSATIVGASLSPPAAPSQLAAIVSGNSVTLTWNAPAGGGAPTTYVLAVGSAAGWSNLASFATGSTATSFSAPVVPNGTYFARVSAQNSAGTSAASNEVSFTVPQACSPPPAPMGLQSSVNGRVLTLSWSAPAIGASSYVIEAGSGPSLADLASVNTGSSATTFTASAPPGTFYLRVRAVNACGVGVASGEVAVRVT